MIKSPLYSYQSILLSLCLSVGLVLRFQALVFAEESKHSALKLPGGILIPRPEGFTDLRDTSPGIFQFQQRLSDGEGKLLAMLVQQEELDGLQDNPEPNFSRYMRVELSSPNAQEHNSSNATSRIAERCTTLMDSFTRRRRFELEEKLHRVLQEYKTDKLPRSIHESLIKPLFVHPKACGRVSLVETVWKSGEKEELIASWSIAAIGEKVLYFYVFAAGDSLTNQNWLTETTEKWVTRALEWNQQRIKAPEESSSDLMLAFWTAFVTTTFGWILSRLRCSLKRS